MKRTNIACDLLVIGGSTAGCFAANTAREQGLDVLVVDKATAGQSGAGIMASGFWAVFNEDWGMDYDSTLAWINANSSYLNNRDWTERFLQDSWGTYLDLKRWGVQFPVPEDAMADFFRGNIATDEDDPHTHYGIVPLSHRCVTPALRRYGDSIGVRVQDRTMVTDLVVRDGAVRGAVGFSLDTGEHFRFEAGAVVLAAGLNYFRSPGMHISGQTGDACAMAYRAGAVLSGKEFPDMHMNIARDPMWKGTGELYPAYFQFDDAQGRRIPNRGFDLSVVSAIHAGFGPIYWDFGKCTQEELQALDEYRKKRNNPKETERVGLDPHQGGKFQMIGGSAAGAAAAQADGLWTRDTDGSSTLPGLYCAGDCCASWMWGAIIQGPPPGLSPAGVEGKRSALAAVRYLKDAPRPALTGEDYAPAEEHMTSFARRSGGFDPRWVTQLLQNYTMPYYILHIKEAKRLEATLSLVGFLEEHMVPRMRAEDPHMLRLAHETENMALNAEMILRASLFRTESRGWHFREDFPHTDDANWLAWNQIYRDDRGKMALGKVDVPARWRPERPVEYRPWLAWEHGDEAQWKK